MEVYLPPIRCELVLVTCFLKTGYGRSDIKWLRRLVNKRHCSFLLALSHRFHLLWGKLSHNEDSSSPIDDTWWSQSLSVGSDSLWLHELHGPRNSPGQNTGVGSLSLLQGIFPIQGSNPGLPHCRQILCQLSHKERHMVKTFSANSCMTEPCWSGSSTPSWVFIHCSHGQELVCNPMWDPELMLLDSVPSKTIGNSTSLLF